MRVLLPISLDRWKNPISTLLRACVQYNFDIEFHSFSSPQTDEDRELGGSFWQLPNLRLRKPSALLTDRFDIVHTASYSHGNYMASVLAKLRGWGHTKLLDTMNLEPHPSHPVCWARYKRVLRWVDGFVAVSHAVSRDIRERVPERFMGVIPNGVDTELYSNKESNPNDMPPAMHDIQPGYPLWIASIEPRKHPEVFLELARKNPSITFVALGHPMGSEGEEMMKKWQQCPNLRWLGGLPRRQAKAILSQAGVLVFPSEREGLSLAMIEAVAMGVPIIAQPKSSMPELVIPGKNGELVDANNLTEWENAIRKWQEPRSSEQEKSLAELRAQALHQYNWQFVGTEYGKIYKAIMQKQPKIYKVIA